MAETPSWSHPAMATILYDPLNRYPNGWLVSPAHALILYDSSHAACPPAAAMPRISRRFAGRGKRPGPGPGRVGVRCSLASVAQDPRSFQVGLQSNGAA